MIADFLQLVVNKTFNHSYYQDNKTAKLLSVKKTLELKTAKMVIEPVFLSENYDDFVINNDTDLNTVDYNKINKLFLENVWIPIDFSKFKHLNKLTLYDCSTITIFKNKCRHFKKIKFVHLLSQEIPQEHEINFYNSVRNAYTFLIYGQNTGEYLSMLKNIHNLHLIDIEQEDFLYYLHSSLLLLENNYSLCIEGFIPYTMQHIVNYIYCNNNNAVSMRYKKINL